MSGQSRGRQGPAYADVWGVQDPWGATVTETQGERETRPPPAETFETYRPLLFAIAYRMLGSATEAEDVVQDAYLRFQATPPESIRSAKAFLSTVVTRLCLDQIKSARARRESYVGPWLPEPLLTEALDAAPAPADRVTQAESISMAFLVLLESLTPLERAVFLLHEVFDYGYDDVAAIVGRSEPACRQLYRRARQHVLERRPRFPAAPAEQERLTATFLRACERGDLDELTGLLAEDVTLWSDGGGKVRAALRPIHGRDAVARFIVGILSKAPPGFRVQHTAVNGAPGIVSYVNDRPIAALALETDGRRIHGLRLVANPDKLARLQ
jgi:RNA polymerase sigma-70 factor, ECF subfamily